MTAGANPTAANGGDGGAFGDFWRAYSVSLVPAVYSILALVAWWVSHGTAGVSTIEMICAVALAVLAVGLQVTGFKVGNRQDYFGGLALVAIGLFALWASRDLSGMRGFAFGPGTAPRGFAIILIVLGAGVGIGGLLTSGPNVERFAFRGPFFIILSICVFAASIRTLGLVFASFVSIVVSAAGTSEVRWIETVIWAAVLTLFCSLLFPWGLNLPLQLWPNGWDPVQLLHLR